MEIACLADWKVSQKVFSIVDVKAAKKKDNAGKERDIAKVEAKMHHAVREDLLRYLQSNILTPEEDVG